MIYVLGLVLTLLICVPSGLVGAFLITQFGGFGLLLSVFLLFNAVVATNAVLDWLL